MIRQVQDYVYEYNYQDPSTYYDVGEGEANVTTPAPVNKYVSVWQHDDASWIFSAVFMVDHPGAGHGYNRRRLCLNKH